MNAHPKPPDDAQAAGAKAPRALAWTVSGMDCASCAARIRGAVERLPGISDVALSVMSERLSLTLAPGGVEATRIEAAVKALGYRLTPIVAKPPQSSDGAAAHEYRSRCGHDEAQDHHGLDGQPHDSHTHARHDHSQPDHAQTHAAAPPGKRWFETAKGRLVIGTGWLLAGAWASKFIVSEATASWAFVAACLIAVAPVARRAIAAAWLGQPFTIEMLMAIATAGALAIGAAEEAALVVFLFAVGEVLEGVPRARRPDPQDRAARDGRHGADRERRRAPARPGCPRTTGRPGALRRCGDRRHVQRRRGAGDGRIHAEDQDGR